MSPQQVEWTILEKLLLTQAVHKYGENMWFQVARVLKQNELLNKQDIQRTSDFYNQKNCSHQYYLLREHFEAEKQASLDEILNDMPMVVRLARHLYSERVVEIKDTLKKQQHEFDQLATEISAIKSGKWDDQLNVVENKSIKRNSGDSILKSSPTLKRQRLDPVKKNEEDQEVELTSITDYTKPYEKKSFDNSAEDQ